MHAKRDVNVVTHKLARFGMEMKDEEKKYTSHVPLVYIYAGQD